VYSDSVLRNSSASKADINGLSGFFPDGFDCSGEGPSGFSFEPALLSFRIKTILPGYLFYGFPDVLLISFTEFFTSFSYLIKRPTAYLIVPWL